MFDLADGLAVIEIDVQRDVLFVGLEEVLNHAGKSEGVCGDPGFAGIEQMLEEDCTGDGAVVGEEVAGYGGGDYE